MKNAMIVLLLFGLNCSSYGQKNVLIEKFTNLYCGSCPDKSILLTNLEQEYPHLIWISHFWPASFEYNPLPFPEAVEMWEEVGITGTPNAIVDRTPYNGQLGSTSGSWENRIQQRQDLEGYADIEFSNVNYNQNNRMLTFEVTSKFHTLPTNLENFRVYAYVTEDNVIWKQASYYDDVSGHPLEGLGDLIWDYSHQNLLRAMPGGRWGKANVIPDNPMLDVEYVETFSYQVPDEFNPSNFELTAAIGQHDESSNLNRSILTAERIALNDFIVSSTIESALSRFETYPNPAHGVINMQFKELPTQILLVDMMGAVIRQYDISELNAQIDIRNLPVGQYILQVFKDDQTISQKVTIQ